MDEDKSRGIHSYPTVKVWDKCLLSPDCLDPIYFKPKYQNNHPSYNDFVLVKVVGIFRPPSRSSSFSCAQICAKLGKNTNSDDFSPIATVFELKLASGWQTASLLKFKFRSCPVSGTFLRFSKPYYGVAVVRKV